MHTTLSISTDDFHFYSHGNGTAYTLYNRNERSDIFWQGDDATQIREEIEEGEQANWSYDAILISIWNLYA